MFKSKLQELCQRKSWDLPEYNTTRDGPAHMPRFVATVNVCGQMFRTPTICRSSKEAQNTAARIAFEHLAASSAPRDAQPLPPPVLPLDSQHQQQAVSPAASLPAAIIPLPEIVQVSQDPPVPESPVPSSLPLPSFGIMSPKNCANSKPGEEVKLQICGDTKDTPAVHVTEIGTRDVGLKETLPMYKNRLQQFAQKQNIGFPVYACETEGPPHARRFKSSVILNGKSYETLEFFSTLKEAEQAAAKVACEALSVEGKQEDSGLYKNLLQEFVQKKGLMCPSYETTSSGMSHMPVFVSTVEVGTYTFQGAQAKTKKQAEMNAAKVAYSALTKSCPLAESSKSSLSSSGVAENLSHAIQPIITPKKHLGEDNGSSTPPTYHSSSPSSEAAHTEQAAADQPPDAQKVVVMPRNSNLPRPEGAVVMPYSDGRWVAYKVEVTKETSA
ncbi:double-stranded RNA-binding protein 1-like isoform X2 [Andrographis paniculata]|uniref:double-stranded RNA-binding protein 1-like isoform X2 n=1 Tax=Andrographis paniculata TaxID=175694 RepID=UPI0021E7369C|nr:double-stranded RNA-binding protein 1-like isoform X2 [Andrographis paniculata]